MSRTGRSIVIGVVILFLLLMGAALIFPLICGSGYGSGYGGMMGPWMMGGFGNFGALLGLLFLVLVVGGVAWFVVTLARNSGSEAPLPGSDTPLEILKRRYAGGEITKEQYEAMKRELGS
jgi:putative membrane protein